MVLRINISLGVQTTNEVVGGFAQILESLDTTVASQVNKHTAQVYNQVLYAFHIISFYTSYDVCDVVFSVDND